MSEYKMEPRFAVLWGFVRRYADTVCGGGEQCRQHDDAANAIQAIQSHVHALQAALASTHFHHKAFIELCPRCQGSLPGQESER